MKENKNELKDRVKAAREILKDKVPRNSRGYFYDSVYGPMFRSEIMKLDNLWNCYSTDEEFTKELEKFAKNPKRNVGTRAEFQRFMDFVTWYRHAGGPELTEKQIQKVYPKFKIKAKK